MALEAPRNKFTRPFLVKKNSGFEELALQIGLGFGLELALELALHLALQLALPTRSANSLCN